eukprot:scaffold4349_cov258-Pinguiococcus_pyrenoidosus.AAC.2
MPRAAWRIPAATPRRPSSASSRALSAAQIGAGMARCFSGPSACFLSRRTSAPKAVDEAARHAQTHSTPRALPRRCPLRRTTAQQGSSAARMRLRAAMGRIDRGLAERGRKLQPIATCGAALERFGRLIGREWLSRARKKPQLPLSPGNDVLLGHRDWPLKTMVGTLAML